MILALRDDNRGPAFFERRQDVIEDQIVARRVLSELRIQLLNCRLLIRATSRKLKLSASEDDLVVEWSARCLLPGINAITDRAALHEDDRVVAVLPCHRGR